MEFVRLPTGEQAPVDADCLRLEEQADGTWKLTASALCVGGDYEGTSVSIVGAPVFDNVADAEANGLAWAANVGVARLVISLGTVQQPLEVLEMDEPL